MKTVLQNEPATIEGESGSQDDGDVEPGIEPLPLSQVFDILRNARRRQALRVLNECGGSSTLSDIAEKVAAWENDKEVAELTSSERKRTYVGLYQCHLPKMDDSGVIEFDKHRGDVLLGPRAPRLLKYIDPEPDRTRPWAKYYLALSGTWTAVFLSGLLAEIAILTSPPVIGFQLLTFLLCSAFHYRDTDQSDRTDVSLASLVEPDTEET